jgi:N-methylhydantoinase B/oxoprolinase/acetone carboxylase alpha subunit
MVYAVLRSVMGGDIPNTAGYFRPVTVSAREGTFVNPLPPAPVAARALGCRRITHALCGALAQMLPDRVFACPGGAEVGVGVGGYDKSKTPWKAWVQLEFHNETACGGRPTKDGTDGQGSNISNLANIPAETIEAEQPIRIEEYVLVPDTDGAGKFRGGLGMARTYRYLLDDTVVQVRADREKTAPYGLSGGLPSTTTEVTVTKGGETSQVREYTHGATVATNAIITRTGAVTGLLTTRGFRDVLELRRMRMHKRYDINWEKPPPLVPRYLRKEVPARMNPKGGEETRLDMGGTTAKAAMIEDGEISRSPEYEVGGGNSASGIAF